jgi:hypothetical protein
LLTSSLVFYSAAVVGERFSNTTLAYPQLRRHQAVNLGRNSNYSYNYINFLDFADRPHVIFSIPPFARQGTQSSDTKLTF